jgi:hypothetical protein
MPKISRRPARGRDFSLDIPFYRTGRLLARILSEEPIDSPLRIFSGTLVNGGAIFTDINGAVRRDVEKRAILPECDRSQEWQHRLSPAHLPGSPALRPYKGEGFSVSQACAARLVNCGMQPRISRRCNVSRSSATKMAYGTKISCRSLLRPLVFLTRESGANCQCSGTQHRAGTSARSSGVSISSAGVRAR